MTFRIATYNVHKCKGMDWKVSSARVADVIGSLGADIVAAQEILVSQAEDISQRIGLPFLFGAARQHAGEPYGNAVFTKLRVKSHESYEITVSGREPRQCLRASLHSPAGISVHFFALHLGTSYLERRKQARLLLYRTGEARFRDKVWLAWAGTPGAGRSAGAHKTGGAYRMLLDMAANWRRPRFALTGQDVMQAGVAQGPEVGRVLAAVEDWWAEGDFTADEAAQRARLAEILAER